MSFFRLLFIPRIGCKTPSPGKIYGSRRYVLIREYHLIMFSSQIFRLGSFLSISSIFLQMFINIFSFINPKNHFSTIDQGFSIFARSLEALVRFISSPCSFSLFHCSSPLSKYKKTPKIFLDFNLLTFLPMDSTSTHYCSNLKIRFKELSINLFDT